MKLNILDFIPEGYTLSPKKEASLTFELNLIQDESGLWRPSQLRDDVDNIPVIKFGFCIKEERMITRTLI